MADQTPRAQNDKEALDMYVDQLIKEKNSPHVNGTNRQEVKAALMKDVAAAINRKFISLLANDDIKELNTLFNAKASNEKIAKFFAQKVPNQQEALTDVLLNFRKGYLSVQYPEKEEIQSLTPAPVQSTEDSFSIPVAPPAPAPKDPSLN